MTVFDADTGLRLGEVLEGNLYLEDERLRETVLPHLDRAGVPVARPASPLTVCATGAPGRGVPEQVEVIADIAEWPTGAVPNLWTFWRPEGLDLRARNADEATDRTTLGHYNPTTRVLWVEDRYLVPAVAVYVARVGLDVAEIRIPTAPWALEAETRWFHRIDPDRKDRYGFGYGDDLLAQDPRGFGPEAIPPVSLLATARQLVDDVVLPTDTVRWLRTEGPGRATKTGLETAEEFALLEQYVRERTTLFGPTTLTGQSVPCRLCGARATQFTTPICADPVAYCHACLIAAGEGAIPAEGQSARRDRVVAAVRRIAEIEFDDAPMLADQLKSVHVDPARPVTGRGLDTRLMLRFAVDRRLPWTPVLADAGLLEAGMRTGRGTVIRARDGHLCLSLREKAVCDFLHLHQVVHEREPFYPVDSLYNPSGKRRADWILADGTLVELWGMPNDPVYAAKMVEKRALAAGHGLRLVEIVDADLPRLPEVFADWLPAEGTVGSGWRWSPLAIVAGPERAADKKPAGDAHGRNAYNAAARDERVARCLQAADLQAAGVTRQQIADRLATGMEAVKALLRDGKFYTDPDSDPGRLRLAETAAAARMASSTRAQFRVDHELSGAKASEAWRDAGVLFPQAVTGPVDAVGRSVPS
ncbi:hypothetical protein [Nocardioides sp. NPDC127503]|uniref:hypothetical protein n=1 Tax=Nocardioides sp. NPDC127503 TaxID=3154516 RepID=UPI00332BDC9B